MCGRFGEAVAAKVVMLRRDVEFIWAKKLQDKACEIFGACRCSDSVRVRWDTLLRVPVRRA
jgi:hypothetical protein